MDLGWWEKAAGIWWEKAAGKWYLGGPPKGSCPPHGVMSPHGVMLPSQGVDAPMLPNNLIQCSFVLNSEEGFLEVF